MDIGGIEPRRRPERNEHTHRRIVPAYDGRSNRMHAGQMFLIRNRIPPRPRQRQIGLQRIEGGDGLGCQQIERQAIQQRAANGGVLKGEQRLARCGAMQGHAAPHLDAHRKTVRRAFGEILRHGAVKPAQCNRLPQFSGQPLQFRGRRRDEIEALPDLVGHFQKTLAQHICAAGLILTDEAISDEGAQDSRECRLRQTGSAQQLGKTQRFRRIGNHVEQGQTLGQCRRAARRLGFHCLCSFASRCRLAAAASSSIRSIVHSASNPKVFLIRSLDVW